jgi:hypothetical protein
MGGQIFSMLPALIDSHDAATVGPNPFDTSHVLAGATLFEDPARIPIAVTDTWNEPSDH